MSRFPPIAASLRSPGIAEWLVALGGVQVLTTLAAVQVAWHVTLLPLALVVMGVVFLSPRAGMFVVLTAMYFRYDFPGWEGVFPVDILVFVLIAGVLIRRALQGRNMVEASPLNLPFVIILAVFALASFNAAFPIPAVVNWLRHVQLFALCTAVIAIVNPDDVPRLLRLMLMMTVVIALFNILQFVSLGGQRRIFGPGGLFFATFLAMAAIHATAGYLLAETRRRRLAWSVLGLILSIGLLATFTRGAWLQALFGIFVMMGILWRWAGRRHKPEVKRRLGLLALGLVVSGMVLWFGQVGLFRPAIERVREAFEGRSLTINTRLFLWKTGLKIFADSPILGSGLGQASRWENILPAWHLEPGSIGAGRLGAHNDFITYLGEVGVAGTLALFFLFWQVIRMGLRLMDRARETVEAHRILVVWIPCCAIVINYFYGFWMFYSIPGMITVLYFGLLGKYYITDIREESPPTVLH